PGGQPPEPPAEQFSTLEHSSGHQPCRSSRPASAITPHHLPCPGVGRRIRSAEIPNRIAICDCTARSTGTHIPYRLRAGIALLQSFTPVLSNEPAQTLVIFSALP